MKSIRKNFSFSLVMLPKLFALLIISQMPSGLVYAWGILGKKKINNIIALLILAFAVFVLKFFMDKAKEMNLVDWQFKSLWHQKWLVLIVFSVCIIYFQFVLGNIFDYLHIEDTVSANQQLINIMIAHSPKYLMLLLSAVFAPICEEIVFRAGFFETIFLGYPRVALIISSFVFALMHMVMSPTDLASWVIYLSMGLILGFVYYKTRRVECSIAVHILWNIYAFFV